MEEINIVYNLVREKTERLDKKQKEEFDAGISKHFEMLEGGLQKTCGEGIDAVMECLWDERETLTEVSELMKGLLSFIRESTDTFEDVDISCGKAIERAE